MAKIIPIDEHFQHFLAELKESFWGDLYGKTRQAWQRFFELESERRRGKQRRHRNSYYQRDFVTRFGTIRLRIARTGEKIFCRWGYSVFSGGPKKCRY
jgi:hypothetical protein